MQPKKIKILIPNATGPTNIGDQAILKGLTNLVKKTFPISRIVVHSSEPYLYKDNVLDDVDHHLYSWAVFEDESVSQRMYRVTCLFINYWLYKSNLPFLLGPEKIRKLINDYNEADIILFVGGGFFRSKKGLTQTLNLLMILMLFQYSKLFKARKIVTPMSFGPFAYDWHEKLSANVLQNFEIVSTREAISFKSLNKYKLQKLILSSDFALLLDGNNKGRKNKTKTIGFTIRNWLEPKGQLKLEHAYINTLKDFAKDNSFQILPIVQTNSVRYGEYDLSITKKVSNALRKTKSKVLKIKQLSTLKDAQQLYSNIDLLLGMRMHSNILAATQNTPFLAVSYEHKSEGIAKELGLEKYCIKSEDVNQEKLSAMLNNLHQNQLAIKLNLTKNLARIKEVEVRRWQKIFLNT